MQAGPREERKDQTGLGDREGQAEHYLEGNFYLHRYDGGREIWKRVGLNA